MTNVQKIGEAIRPRGLGDSLRALYSVGSAVVFLAMLYFEVADLKGDVSALRSARDIQAKENAGLAVALAEIRRDLEYTKTETKRIGDEQSSRKNRVYVIDSIKERVTRLESRVFK